MARNPKPESGDDTDMEDEDADEVAKQAAGDEFKLDDGQRVWDCEFCGNANVVDIEDEEIPKGISQDYLIESGPQTKLNAKDARLIIFCIDTSSSMAVGDHVPGTLKLKGDHSARQRFLGIGGSPRPNHTFVTRLQAVQAAVDDQLKHFAKTCPNYRIALIAFNNALTIYGDGSMEPQKLSGADLHDSAKLRSVGRKCTVAAPISESHKKLSEALFELKHARLTALGPALTVAVSMASSARGSKVVLCTDGLASVGLGQLLWLSEERTTAAEKWYSDTAKIAVHAGVTVDVISISDDYCSLEVVGGVADQTKGRVDKLNIPDVAKNFKGILQNPVVATNVNAKMFVHRGLRLRNENDDISSSDGASDNSHASKSKPRKAQRVNDIIGPQKSPNPESASSSAAVSSSSSSSSASSKKNKNNKRKRGSVKKKPQNCGSRCVVDRIARDVGNVTVETEVFFEFSVRKKNRKSWNKLAGLPFQVQIEYTRLDGARCIRVVTQMKEVTLSKAQAEDHADVSVLAAHGARKSASYVQMGDYESSRRVNFGHALYMDRVSTTGEQQEVLSRYVSAVRHWDRSVSGELTEEYTNSPHISRSDQAARVSMRSRRRNDSLSNAMYSMKGLNTPSFSSLSRSYTISRTIDASRSASSVSAVRQRSSKQPLQAPSLPSQAPKRAQRQKNPVYAGAAGPSSFASAVAQLNRVGAATQNAAPNSRMQLCGVLLTPHNEAAPEQPKNLGQAQARAKSYAAWPAVSSSSSSASSSSSTAAAAAKSVKGRVIGYARRGGMSRFGTGRADLSRFGRLPAPQNNGVRKEAPKNGNEKREWWRMPQEQQKKRKTKPSLVIDLSEGDSPDNSPAITPAAVEHVASCSSSSSSSAAVVSGFNDGKFKSPKKLLASPGNSAQSARAAPNSLSPAERRKYVPPADSAAYAAARQAQLVATANALQLKHSRNVQVQMQATAAAHMQMHGRPVQAHLNAHLPQVVYNPVAYSVAAQGPPNGANDPNQESGVSPPCANGPQLFQVSRLRVQSSYQAAPSAPSNLIPGDRLGVHVGQQQAPPQSKFQQNAAAQYKIPTAQDGNVIPKAPYGPPAVPLSSKAKQSVKPNGGWFSEQRYNPHISDPAIVADMRRFVFQGVVQQEGVAPPSVSLAAARGGWPGQQLGQQLPSQMIPQVNPELLNHGHAGEPLSANSPGLAEAAGARD